MKAENKKTFTDVPAQVNVDALELEILGYWEKNKIFDRSLAQNKKHPQFTFYDGPPYATGKPHYGSILQSVIKDAVLRYKTMRGYYVPRRVGWDCHGLPVENLVEKELGIKTKQEIEELGIEKFNQRCRDTVFRYIDDFTNTLKRMGRWADYDNAYATLNRDYMESEWWVFKQLWDQGLVYRAFRSTPFCIRCSTPLSNFEVSINYKDTTDTAVFVLLPVNPTSLPKELRGENHPPKLLIWTTTPWTLPGNAAVAINPELRYVTVVDEKGDQIIVAHDRLPHVFSPDIKVIYEWQTSDLLNICYQPLYPQVTGTLTADEKGNNLFKVIASGHVVADEGTGLVHIAPAFGEEDAELGKKYHLPVLRTVNMDGSFTREVPTWAGENIFTANETIVDELARRALLFKKEKYRHSYPFCWRCETPLIYYALDTWFIKVADLKSRMIAIAEQINWTPSHVKKGRFGKGLESAPDWAVSRNRYWSVPIPIWECVLCHSRICLGSVKELVEKNGGNDIPDIHRPYVDEITWPCEKCRGVMRRIPEVLDVWFDAGSMPYAQSHYPFANKELVERSLPADFIVEMIEQTRLWFYVLHVLVTALTTKDIGLGKDKPAFKHAVASGLIFAEDGRKLSKKLKNYPEPEPTIARFGADTLRLYLLSSATLGETYRFSEKDLKKMHSTTYLTLWNVYSFFVRYAKTHEIDRMASTWQETNNLLDQWIKARVKQFVADTIQSSEQYRVDTAARLVIPFVDDLSNWYVRRSRARFQRPGEEREKQQAFGTLFYVLEQTALVLAPYTPYISEIIYRNLTGKESVHLASLTEPAGINEEEAGILTRMTLVRAVVSSGLALRAKKGIKVRQPLLELLVKTEGLSQDLMDIIKEEVNVKEIKFVTKLPTGENYVQSGEEDKVGVVLNIELTDELKQEGVAREIIRHGQILRRQAGYALNDRIKISFATEDNSIRAAFNAYSEIIMNALQADALSDDSVHSDASTDFNISSAKVTLTVGR